MTIWHDNSICPLCGQTQDRFGDHALSWVCGGDRVCRRNAVRDVVHSIARDCSSLVLVKEKLGLLPPRAPSHETPLLLPFRSGQPRPQPPSRHLGFSRSLWAGRNLGLLHQQWPVPVPFVQSKLGLRHCFPVRGVSRTAACARSGGTWRGLVLWPRGGFLSSWPSLASRSSASLPSTEASLTFAQRAVR